MNNKLLRYNLTRRLLTFTFGYRKISYNNRRYNDDDIDNSEKRKASIKQVSDHMKSLNVYLMAIPENLFKIG